MDDSTEAALRPRPTPGYQAHLGLERQDEVASLNGFGQRFLGIDPFLVFDREGGVEQAVPPAAARFSAVHGDIRRSHQRFDARPVIGR